MSILCRSREFRYSKSVPEPTNSRCAHMEFEQSLSFLAPKLTLNHLLYVFGITARLKSVSVKSDA